MAKGKKVKNKYPPSIMVKRQYDGDETWLSASEWKDSVSALSVEADETVEVAVYDLVGIRKAKLVVEYEE